MSTHTRPTVRDSRLSTRERVVRLVPEWTCQTGYSRKEHENAAHESMAMEYDKFPEGFVDRWENST